METQAVFDKTLSLVLACGDILKNVERDKDAQTKSDGTLVTEYDLIIDEKLSKGLRSICNCSILSEEHEELVSGDYFVIDPIDGTHNFNAGYEAFGIIVAFVQNNDTQFGIIHLPLLEKTVTAFKGEGAFVNGRRIHVNDSGDLLFGSCGLNKEAADIMPKLMASGIDLRCSYCSAMDTAYVANGVFDFDIRYKVCGPWDFVAAKLIIEEAGGVLKYAKNENGKYSVLSGTPKAVEKIEKLLGDI